MSDRSVKEMLGALLDEGLEHYRKGRMADAVRSWEAASRVAPASVRLRELLRSARSRLGAGAGEGAEALPLASGAPSSASAPSPAAPFPASAPSPAPWQPPVRPQAPAGAAAGRRSPWDEGPSVAVPHEADSVADAVGWGIHADSGHGEGAEDASQTAVWLRGARELQALADFSGALELTSKVLQHEPGHAEAEHIHAQCEETLTQMFESKLSPLSRRPRVALKPDEVIWLNLDPQAGFVLAQIDGEVSIEDLHAICGLSRLETARILSHLLDERVIRLDEAPQRG